MSDMGCILAPYWMSKEMKKVVQTNPYSGVGKGEKMHKY